MIVTVPAAQARSVAQLGELYYEGPDYTATGVVCGACTDSLHVSGEPRVQVRHASVELVGYCADLRQQIEAESAAELAAEAAVERYFEERGAQDDPRERELWALEDYRRGL